MSSTEATICLDLGNFPRVSSRVREAYLTALDVAGADPRGVYSSARRSYALLEAARGSVATSIGVHPAEVRFVSNFTSGVHASIGAVLRGHARLGDIVLTSAVERAAVQSGAEFFASDVLIAPVDGTGTVCVDDWDRLIQADDVGLAVVQHANQETGVGQDIESLYASAKAAGVPLLIDASMTLGRVPVPKQWDALVADGRSLGAPVGIGIVVVRHSTRWLPAWPEDADAWQPGGIHVAAVVACAAALEECMTVDAAGHQRELTNALGIALADIDGVAVVAAEDDRTAGHVACVTLSDVDGELLATALDQRGIAVGAGSSCAAGGVEPSHVLRAMGIDAAGSIRISLDAASTRDDVDALIRELPQALASTRALLSPSGI